MQLLDQWNDSLEPEQKTKVLRENFLAIDRAIQGTGLFLLRTLTAPANQNINSGTYTDVPQLSGQFNSSGGLIVVLGMISVITSNTTGYLKLLIDGQLANVSFCGINANGNDTMPMFYVTSLNAGSHTIGAQIKSAGGNVTFFDTEAITTFYVLEYLKG